MNAAGVDSADKLVLGVWGSLNGGGAGAGIFVGTLNSSSNDESKIKR